MAGRLATTVDERYAHHLVPIEIRATSRTIWAGSVGCRATCSVVTCGPAPLTAQPGRVLTAEPNPASKAEGEGDRHIPVLAAGDYGPGTTLGVHTDSHPKSVYWSDGY